MSLTFHQASNAFTASGTTVTVAFPANVTAGDLILVFTLATANASTVSLVDTQTNSYTFLQSGTGNGELISSWWAVAKTTGPCSITFTASSAVTLSIIAAEYSGQATSPIDTAFIQTLAPVLAGVLTTNPITTSFTNEQIVAIVWSNNAGSAWASNGSFTARTINPKDFVNAGCGDGFFAAAGSYAATLSGAGTQPNGVQTAVFAVKTTASILVAIPNVETILNPLESVLDGLIQL